MKPKSNLRHFLALAGSSLLAISYSHAATVNWDGDTSTNWADAGNWDVALVNTSDLVFSGTSNQTNTNNTLTDILSLTLNNGGWNINLNTLSIGSGGIVANGTSTLGGTLTLGGAQSWSNSTGLLTVTGTVNNNSNLLTVGGAGNTNIQSVVSGSGGLTKNGAGILTLSAANSYSGATTVTLGTFKLGAAGDGTNSALGTIAAGTDVASGGALDLNGITLSTAEALSLIGTGVSTTGALTNSGAAASYTGIVTIGTGGASIGGSGNITLSAALAANANTLTKVGAGKLTLQAASTRTGTTVIDGGTLRIENATAFGTVDSNAANAVININNGGTLEVGTTATILSGGGSGGGVINLNNGGTISSGLAGTNAQINKIINIQTTGTPVVTFDSGSNAANVLNLEDNNGKMKGGIAGAKIQIQGSGTVKILANTGHTLPNLIGDWYLQGGTLQFGGDGQIGNAANDFYFQGGTLSTYGAFTLGASRVLNFNHASGGTVNTTGGSLTLGTDGQLSGANQLTKVGTNSLIISGNNAGFTGGVTINAGILNLGGSTANGSLASTALALGGGTLSYTRTGSTTQTFSTTAINAAASSVSTVAGNTLALGAITRSAGGTLNVGAAGTITTSNSNVNDILAPWASFNTGASTTYATKSGSNIVGLGYTGGADGVAPGAASIVTDTTGSLNYSVDTATGTFGTAASINTLRYTAGASTLTTATSFKTNGIMNSGSGVLTISGDITIGATNELVLNAANNGITISNAIGNNGSTASSITKTGSSTVILNGVSTYTGNTFVNQGTLQIGNNGANGAKLGGSSGTYAGNIFIASGATLHIQTDANQELSGIISGDGALIKANTGNLTLGNDNTYTGKTSITPISGPTGAGTVFITSFNSVNGGTPLLTKSSLGAPTTVANGTINLGATGTAKNAAIEYSGGASGETTDRIINFQFNNSASNNTISTTGVGLLKFTSAATSNSSGGNVILRGAGNGEFSQGLPGLLNLTKSDSGTWTLGGAVASTGVLTVNAGTLALQKKSSLHSGNTANWTAAKINVKIDATLALNVDSGDVNGLSATSLDTLLTGISSGGTSTAQGLQAGAILGLNTSTATGGSFTQGNAITNSTGTGGGSLGLTKLGTGTLVLDKTNTYTGATTVTAGTLAVNGSLANTSTTIGAGTPNTGTLQGSGSIGGSVTILSGGTLAPGNSIESLGTGAVSFLSGSTYAYELQTNLYGTTPGLAGDLTDSTGTLDIQAGSILTLTDLAASTALAAGSKLTLISYFGGWTETELFNYNATTLNDGATFTLGLNQWRFDYNDTTGGLNYTADQSGATGFVTMTVIVPEPNVAALLGSLGLLALLRRRR